MSSVLVRPKSGQCAQTTCLDANHRRSWSTCELPGILSGVAQRKERVPIPADVAAEALFKSDRTCCVCHVAGKQVQIHHINDDPSDNHSENFAVLCLECHAQTQISGGFGRKLNARLVTLYRDHWLTVIEMRRTAESLESELLKSSTHSQQAEGSARDILPKVPNRQTATGDSVGRVGVKVVGHGS